MFESALKSVWGQLSDSEKEMIENAAQKLETFPKSIKECKIDIANKILEKSEELRKAVISGEEYEIDHILECIRGLCRQWEGFPISYSLEQLQFLAKLSELLNVKMS